MTPTLFGCKSYVLIGFDRPATLGQINPYSRVTELDEDLGNCEKYPETCTGQFYKLQLPAADAFAKSKFVELKSNLLFDVRSNALPGLMFQYNCNFGVQCTKVEVDFFRCRFEEDSRSTPNRSNFFTHN